MNNDYTHITMVLDKSGSMSVLTDVTIEGFNRFLKEQKGIPGKCTMTLFQFATETECTNHFAELKDIAELNNESYVANGRSTSLYDAIAQAIHDTGEDLKKMNEADRPAKVIVVIQTDGEENSSRKYNKAKVKELIIHQESKYNWKFLFLSSDLTSADDALAFGISKGNILRYAASPAGNDAMYTTYSTAVAHARGIDVDAFADMNAFTDDDQQV